MRERVIHLTKKDFVVQHFRAGGKGGQNQNARDSAARVIHPASGARGESREHRTQLANRKAAFLRMTETSTFRVWLAQAHMRLDPQEVEDKVDRMMREENLLVEYGKKRELMPNA